MLIHNFVNIVVKNYKKENNAALESGLFFLVDFCYNSFYLKIMQKNEVEI